MRPKNNALTRTTGYIVFVEQAIQHALFSLEWQMYLHDHHRWNPEVAFYWCEFREQNRGVLLTLALGGWMPAHDLLTEMASFLTKLGEPLPLWLQEYVVASARVQMRKTRVRRRGQNPAANATRDLVIAATVESVAERHRIRRTRSCGTERESACSIVTKALVRSGAHMSESRVVSIWQAHERSARERQRYVDAADAAGERALMAT